MTDTDIRISQPPSREEVGLADVIGRKTLLPNPAKRHLPWFTDSVGVVQKSFELVVAMAMCAFLFWGCVAFFVVARDVFHEQDTAAELRSENKSLEAEVDEWREQTLLLEAENRDLADELREAERKEVGS